VSESNLDKERVDPLGEGFLLHGILLVYKPHTHTHTHTTIMSPRHISQSQARSSADAEIARQVSRLTQRLLPRRSAKLTIFPDLARLLPHNLASQDTTYRVRPRRAGTAKTPTYLANRFPIFVELLHYVITIHQRYRQTDGRHARSTSATCYSVQQHIALKSKTIDTTYRCNAAPPYDQ